MTDHFHALFWIDHREAKVFQFNAMDVDCTTIRSQHSDQHIHHKANAGDSGHASPDNEFFKRVIEGVAHAEAILITASANAKTELVAYITRVQPNLAERISSVQTRDHPSDGALVALGRSFFKADDRMHHQAHR